MLPGRCDCGHLGRGGDRNTALLALEGTGHLSQLQAVLIQLLLVLLQLNCPLIELRLVLGKLIGGGTGGRATCGGVGGTGGGLSGAVQSLEADEADESQARGGGQAGGDGTLFGGVTLVAAGLYVACHLVSRQEGAWRFTSARRSDVSMMTQ